MKRILVGLFLLCSEMASADQVCNGKFVEDAISIYKVIEGVSTYSFNAKYQQQSGTVKSYRPSNYYIVLDWEPEQGDGGFFILAFDLHKRVFYIHHGRDASGMRPTFYSGKLDSENCKVDFDISSDVAFSIELPNRKTVLMKQIDLKGNNSNVVFTFSTEDFSKQN